MKWLTMLFTLFIILIIVLADADRLGLLKLVNRLPLGDKAGHFILYGILALLSVVPTRQGDPVPTPA